MYIIDDEEEDQENEIDNESHDFVSRIKTRQTSKSGMFKFKK